MRFFLLQKETKIDKKKENSKRKGGASVGQINFTRKKKPAPVPLL